MSPRDDRRIAYHEAGHAVAAVVLRIHLESVTIEADAEGEFLGRCVVRAVQPDSPNWYRRKHVRCVLAASEAEHLLDAPDYEPDLNELMNELELDGDTSDAIRLA